MFKLFLRPVHRLVSTTELDVSEVKLQPLLAWVSLSVQWGDGKSSSQT